MLNKSPKTDDNTIREIYKLAQTCAKSYHRTHPGSYLDIDDLVQEGMIGYLKGQNIKFAMSSAYLKAVPLKRSRREGVPLPIHQGVYEETLTSDEDDAYIEVAILIGQLWEMISTVFDARTADIMHRRYKLGHTLDQIGTHYSRTGTRINQIINQTLTKLKRRLA